MKVNVLDHGYVVLRNISGPTRRPEQEFDASDIDPPQVARISFDAIDTNRSLEDDLKLSKYLMKNWHTSPFESIEVWLEMKLPIFVARQFAKHRTTTINEVSGRYVTLPSEWYVPDIEKVKLQSKDKKQGGVFVDMSDSAQVQVAKSFVERLDSDCFTSYCAYRDSIEAGICMEQARAHLHVNHYTHWVWKQNLHNLMHFMSLRDHPHAQEESATYARAVDSLVRGVLPETMKLYDEFRRLK